jgi:hypothetical protein
MEGKYIGMDYTNPSEYRSNWKTNSLKVYQEVLMIEIGMEEILS